MFEEKVNLIDTSVVLLVSVIQSFIHSTSEKDAIKLLLIFKIYSLYIGSTLIWRYNVNLLHCASKMCVN